MQGRLKPGRPQDGEEADIGEQGAFAGDGVISGKGSQVGDEKQVEEELDGVGLMSLMEDQFGLGAHTWILDPGYDVMLPPLLAFVMPVNSINGC